MSRRIVRGFTLVELLVVVVIIAVVLAIVVPAVVSRITSQPAASANRAIAQQPPTVVATEGVRARIERSNVHVRLGTRPFLDGVDVASEYVATFEGELELAADRAGEVDVVFDLPPGVTEARDVALLVKRDSGFVEPPGVDYSPSSIRWRATIDDRMTVRVRYEAIGRDAFVYDLVGGGRAEVARFVLDVDDAAIARIPADALAPTSRHGNRIEWAFDRLVATRPIRVELTHAGTPLGRFLALFRFAALGVLLFGAGFWYTSEGRAPGRLDRFRLPHFTLLALDYAVFFVVLGVLGLELELPTALAVSSAIGLPLLALHVARVTDTRYALTYAMPVAVLTYATVVASVAWPDQRIVVWTLAGVGVLVYVTVTYRRWSQGRAEHRARACEAQKLRVTTKEHVEATRAFQAARREAAVELERARAVQLATAPDLAVEHAQVVRCSAELRLDADEPPDTASLLAACERTRERTSRLEAATQALGDAHESAWSQLWPALATLAARIEANREVTDTAGARWAEGSVAHARYVEAVAALADAEALHARVLASTDADPSAVRPRTIEREARRLAARLTELGEALATAPVVTHAAEHCPACGHALTAGDRFCAGCGTGAPEHFDCGRCGGHLSVPVHLSRRRWRSAALHCPACGDALAAT